ncbi:MAG TPA: sigma-54 dependent transcriptional regulator, partial [Candidatus Aminicenantes bacterium]|nr:sigma-54 dependent transcriptional regulator [Candidatus Aminicenantes bacterium]
MRNGAADYIQKPFAADKLLGRVERHFPSRFSGTPPGDFLTRSPSLQSMLARVRRAAATGAAILIRGESGTGKEVLARFVHRTSPRHDFPYVALNCAAIPENLLESELFGYEKGAFTGADRLKPGKFELADRGTLVLDEIGDMPLHLQAKILRVIQEREVDRLGGKKSLRVDVRIVSLTNQDIRERIGEKTFREDLYFRLNVVEFSIPPLRERPEDIPYLAETFLEVIGKELAHPPLAITPAAREKLLAYPWPGNVRELQNAMQRAAIFCDGQHIDHGDLEFSKGEPRHDGISLPADIQTVAAMEKELILRTLERTSGNRGKAAELLGISARTLRNKLQEYRLEENPLPPP